MITFKSEPLPHGAELELRQWLGKTQLRDLLRVVQSKQQKEECAALRDAISAKDFPGKLDAANESLRRAQRYQTFIDVMHEVVSQQNPFEIAKFILE